MYSQLQEKMHRIRKLYWIMSLVLEKRSRKCGKDRGVFTVLAERKTG